MHITLESDYAVRIVDALASANTRLDASAISQCTGVTLRFSLKILRKLVSAGIIRSYKGAKGGYELASPPEEITLKAVIETVEGVYTFSRCLSPGHVCHCDSADCRKGACRFQKVFDEISEHVRDSLGNVTFAAKE